MQGIEPLFQQFRIHKIAQHFPSQTKNKVLLDLGCDVEQTVLRAFEPKFKKLIGVDIVVEPMKQGKIEIVQSNLENELPIASNSVDVITMLAVLEHLQHPEISIAESFRVLKKGGILLLTVPSPQSEPVLELLANLRIIRREMIDQHENYFTHRRLRRMAKEVGFSDVIVESWQYGFNTFMKAVK